MLQGSPQSQGGPGSGQSALQRRDAHLPAQLGVVVGRVARLPARLVWATAGRAGQRWAKSAASGVDARSCVGSGGW
eukprot:14884690-Alexandrium_andersonii.AAC.1